MKKLICLCVALASLQTAPALAGGSSNDDVPGFARENFPHLLSLDFMNTFANNTGQHEQEWPICQYSTRDLILMEFGMRGNYNPVHRITTDGSDTKIYGEYEANPRSHNPRQGRSSGPGKRTADAKSRKGAGSTSTRGSRSVIRHLLKSTML